MRGALGDVPCGASTVKLKFHGTDTDTDTDFRARILGEEVRVSVDVGPVEFKLIYVHAVLLLCVCPTPRSPGTHVPHEITRCYLPPDRGDIPAFTKPVLDLSTPKGRKAELA